MLEVINIIRSYKTLSFCVGNESFGAGDKHNRHQGAVRSAGSERFWRWRRTRIALKTNEANAFYAGDEITRLALEANAFSAKDGTRLTLKANLLGARDELTRSTIDRNWRRTRLALETNPKPKVEQPSSFLAQIFGNTELTVCLLRNT